MRLVAGISGLLRGRLPEATAIFALRSAAIALVVLILLDPVRVEQVEHAGPAPSAIFLVDESQSMTLEAPLSRTKAVEQMIRRGDALMRGDRGQSS